MVSQEYVVRNIILVASVWYYMIQQLKFLIVEGKQGKC